MFAVLRIVAVIGVIFYFSPVRLGADRPSHGGAREPPATTPPVEALAADAVWRTLPTAAKQALLEPMFASALGTDAPRGSEPLPVPARDTLEPEDLQPAWRGEDARGQTHAAARRATAESRKSALEGPARVQRSTEKPRG